MTTGIRKPADARVAGAHRGPGTSPTSYVGRVLRSGWLPAAVAAVTVAGALLWFEVSPLELIKFSIHVLAGLTIPGALLWRAAHGAPRSMPEDLAAGTVVGYAAETLFYLPARAVGAPYLVLLFPVAVTLIFILVPRLRRFWRGGGPKARPPLWFAWLLSLTVILLVAWSAAIFFRSHGLTWPGNASPYFDMPYQLALAAELKHHFPPAVPYLADEPLRYHWFVHADLAATSWATGIDLQTLLYRLALWPMLAALTVLVAILAVRLTGHWWTGPAAVAVTYFSFLANPYGWAALTFFDAQNLGALWTSPTNAFGLTLCAGAVLVLTDLLGARTGSLSPAERRGRVLSWIVFVMLIAAVMGAKATFVPMLLAGLLLVLLGDLVRRRPNRSTLLALGVTGGALLIAQLVVFGGSDGAAQVAPLTTVRHFVATGLTGLTASPKTSTVGVLAVIAMLAVVGWALMWAGLFGLVGGRARIAERPILLLLGLSGSAFVALMTLEFPGWAQAYFLRGAGPFLAVLTMVGLAAVLPVGRRAVPWLAAGALVVGALIATAVRELGRSTPPTLATEGRVRWVLVSMTLPWAAVVAAVVLIGVVLYTAGRRWDWLRGVSLALALLVAMGASLPQAWRALNRPFETAAAYDWAPTLLADGQPEIDKDGLTAARWLRSNSNPSDLVATNVHCRPIYLDRCDNRHFWISAYTERRVLIEGWGYTLTGQQLSVKQRVGFMFVEYWRKPVLQDNDAAFTAPSRDVIDRLRTAYGVRWLFADSRLQAVSPDLPKFATLRFQVGHCAVYEIVE